MNHRRQSVHNRDVCVQLYSGICRPFIIFGQSLQKHSGANILLSPTLPLLLHFYLSVLHSPNPFVPPTFPPFFLSAQTSSLFNFHSASSLSFPVSPPYSCTQLHPRPHPLSVSGWKTKSFIHLFSLPCASLFLLVNAKLQTRKKC